MRRRPCHARSLYPLPDELATPNGLGTYHSPDRHEPEVLRDMKARVKWLEDVAFVGESGSGHSVVLDGDPGHGGRNIGIRPMEAMLIGAGACSAFDVVTILKKSRQAVSDCVVELDAKRAAEAPKVFTEIDMKFTVSGRQLSEKSVARAVRLSAEKYCSATAMLRAGGVEVSHRFEIEEVG